LSTTYTFAQAPGVLTTADVRLYTEGIYGKWEAIAKVRSFFF
jgi:hypothetical protein